MWKYHNEKLQSHKNSTCHSPTLFFTAGSETHELAARKPKTKRHKPKTNPETLTLAVAPADEATETTSTAAGSSEQIDTMQPSVNLASTMPASRNADVDSCTS